MHAPDPTRRFSERAEAYGKHRPGYPPRAFDELLAELGDASRLVAADIGAGTGISTRLLAERIARVIAVEPNAQMRERALPAENVVWAEGTAEATGLPDCSVDVAAAFQAFHWFEASVAFAEFARIARRRIALVQYERDETQAFPAAYARLIHPYLLDDTESRRVAAMERFSTLAGSRLRRSVVAWSQSLTLDGLLGRVDSTSYLPRAGAAGEALRSGVRQLFAEFARGGTIEMAMNVFVLASDVA